MRILQQAGFDPIVVPSSYTEPDIPGLSPEELAKRHAYQKTRQITVPHKSGVVVACDTIVVSNYLVFGKPSNKKHAMQMLKRHSNNLVKVVTGLCIRNLDTDQSFTCTNISIIKFAKLEESDILWYLEHKEWQGKSGGFSIVGLGSRFIKSIRGDMMAVQGIPVSTLHKCLVKWGCTI